jgi:hypothetical protein
MRSRNPLVAVLPFQSHFSMTPCCGPDAAGAAVGRTQAATVTDPVTLREAESGTDTMLLLVDTARLAGLPAGTAALLTESMAAPPINVPLLAGDVPDMSFVLPPVALLSGQ